MEHPELRRAADVVFLALTGWREARGETHEGIAGVMHACMNRVERPSWWGRDLLSVLFKKWQFSSLTDPNDKQLTTWPTWTDPSWLRCLVIADGVLEGSIANPVPGADSYYDISIPAPKWAKTARLVAQIGRLVFFDVDNDFER